MKKFIITLLAFTSLSLLADSRVQPSAMKIEFQSYGMGISHEALGHAQGMIATAVGQGMVNFFKQTPWGIEGEITLCMEAPYQTLYPIYEAMGQIEVEGRYPRPVATFLSSCGDMNPSFPGMER